MRVRSELGAVVRLVAVVLVVGALVGLGWALLTPGLPVGIRSDGVALVLSPESRSRFDAVGYLAVASLAAGVLTGAAAWRWRRWRGPTILVALVLASTAAGVVALAVGQLVTGIRFPLGAAAPGSTTTAPPELTTWTLALLQPAGAVLAYTLAVAFSKQDDPRGEGSSSGRAEPGAVPAEPGPLARP